MHIFAYINLKKNYNTIHDEDKNEPGQQIDSI